VRAGPQWFAGKAELTWRPHGVARENGSARERLGVLTGWVREAERTKVHGRGQVAPTGRPLWAEGGGRERRGEETAADM
jgi:hypothetical protein